MRFVLKVDGISVEATPEQAATIEKYLNDAEDRDGALRALEEFLSQAFNDELNKRISGMTITGWGLSA